VIRVAKKRTSSIPTVVATIKSRTCPNNFGNTVPREQLHAPDQPGRQISFVGLTQSQPLLWRMRLRLDDVRAQKLKYAAV